MLGKSSMTISLYFLPLSQHRSWTKRLGLMQLPPKWSRRWKGSRNNPDLRSPFPQLLGLLTWPKPAENNYPLSKIERSREEIVPFWNAAPPGLEVLWSSTATLKFFLPTRENNTADFQKITQAIAWAGYSARSFVGSTVETDCVG